MSTNADQVQCLACGGVYRPILPDGMAYFHACPPLSLPELAAAVAERRVILPAGESVEEAIQARTYLRSDTRDENARAASTAGASAMKAAGAGVTPVAAADPTVVVVSA